MLSINANPTGDTTCRHTKKQASKPRYTEAKLESSRSLAAPPSLRLSKRQASHADKDSGPEFQQHPHAYAAGSARLLHIVPCHAMPCPVR